MNDASVLLCVTITSVGAGLLGVRSGLLAPKRLRMATRQTFEVLGLAFAFFVLNAALLAGGAIAVRSLSGLFLSVYVVNDLAVVALSLFQGVFVGHWRQLSATEQKLNPQGSAIAAS